MLGGFLSQDYGKELNASQGEATQGSLCLWKSEEGEAAAVPKRSGAFFSRHSLPHAPFGQEKQACRMGLKGSSGDSRPNSEEGILSPLSLMLGLSTAAKRGKKQAGSVWEEPRGGIPPPG
ncbi:hypothetical protein E2320_022413 [Naja naja]|nr:hypothetical protein E2320_022413 [Naja naja]